MRSSSSKPQVAAFALMLSRLVEPSTAATFFPWMAHTSAMSEAVRHEEPLAVLEVGQAEVDLLGPLRRLGQGSRDQVRPALLQRRDALVGGHRQVGHGVGIADPALGELVQEVDLEPGAPAILAVERERLEVELHDRGQAASLPDAVEAGAGRCGGARLGERGDLRVGRGRASAGGSFPASAGALVSGAAGG